MVYRAVFFGTPRFAAIILDYLATKSIDIVAVVTNPDKPVKRSKEPVFSPVKVKAQELHIPIYQPEKASSESFVQFLKELHADLFLVVAYGEIFKENFLEVPPLGCINVHASLLPKYRGAAPIQRAIWEGEKESGVSIMKIAKQMDAGGVYKKVSLPIGDTVTAGEFSEKLAALGAQALWEVIVQIEEGAARLLEQEESIVTFAHKLHAKDAHIDFTRSAIHTYNQIRACTPKPGAWCWVEIKGEKKRLLIKSAEKNTSLQGISGQILPSEESTLWIACSEGAIGLLRIQLEGKKEMSVAEFLRGYEKTNLKF
jgi:methionyl-tRNA formyltransferase